MSASNGGLGRKPDFDRAWTMMIEDERMASIRKKLSIHEVRMLFYIAVEGLWGPPQESGLHFKERAYPFID